MSSSTTAQTTSSEVGSTKLREAGQGSSGPALNRAALIGRLTRDPQLRHTATGRAVATLRVAVNDGPEPAFHDVVVWGKTAEAVCKYLAKGRLIHVEGRMQQRMWTDKNDNERVAFEVVANRVQFLPGGSSAADTEAA